MTVPWIHWRLTVSSSSSSSSLSSSPSSQVPGLLQTSVMLIFRSSRRLNYYSASSWLLMLWTYVRSGAYSRGCYGGLTPPPPFGVCVFFFFFFFSLPCQRGQSFMRIPQYPVYGKFTKRLVNFSGLAWRHSLHPIVKHLRWKKILRMPLCEVLSSSVLPPPPPLIFSAI